VYPFPSISLDPSLKDSTCSDPMAAKGAGDRHYETGTYKPKEKIKKSDLIILIYCQRAIL
jgi:hypothetical protein